MGSRVVLSSQMRLTVPSSIITSKACQAEPPVNLLCLFLNSVFNFLFKKVPWVLWRDEDEDSCQPDWQSPPHVHLLPHQLPTQTKHSSGDSCWLHRQFSPLLSLDFRLPPTHTPTSESSSVVLPSLKAPLPFFPLVVDPPDAARPTENRLLQFACLGWKAPSQLLRAHPWCKQLESHWEDISLPENDPWCFDWVLNGMNFTVM